MILGKASGIKRIFADWVSGVLRLVYIYTFSEVNIRYERKNRVTGGSVCRRPPFCFGVRIPLKT